MRSGDAPISDQEQNNAPMIEIFGGVFALLLVLFLLINAFFNAAVEERLSSLDEQGNYIIGWETKGAGYTVISFPDMLSIVETGRTVAKQEICQSGSAFLDYAAKVYAQPKTQLIFVILEGSVEVMSKARDCLRSVFPTRDISIGWIIADKELLKSVTIGDIPPYIQKTLKARQ